MSTRPFTPRFAAYDSESGEWFARGRMRRWKREENRKMDRIYCPPRQLLRWKPSPTERPF